MQTYSGRKFWPLDPRPEDVDPSDIAHALANQCRFAGHCLRFYSVAEHSILVSRALPPEHQLWGLLHDASEAYLVDVPRPLKPFLRGYVEMEAAVMSAICRRFDIPEEMPPEVKRVDNAILASEAAQNMSPPPERWSTDSGERVGVNLYYWSPETAERAYWSELLRLTLNPRIW